jgi:hypothetical protein
MKQYVLAMYQPDGEPPPPEVLGPIMERIGRWNDELKGAGAWVFTGRLHLAHASTTVQVKDGEVVMTDGPYLEGKEHLGGFTVIRAADLDEALGWAGKLAEAIGVLPVEVRPIWE